MRRLGPPVIRMMTQVTIDTLSAGIKGQIEIPINN